MKMRTIFKGFASFSMVLALCASGLVTTPLSAHAEDTPSVEETTEATEALKSEIVGSEESSNSEESTEVSTDTNSVESTEGVEPADSAETIEESVVSPKPSNALPREGEGRPLTPGTALFNTGDDPTKYYYWVNTGTSNAGSHYGVSNNTVYRTVVSDDKQSVQIDRSFPVAVSEGYGDIAVSPDGKFLYGVGYHVYDLAGFHTINGRSERHSTGVYIFKHDAVTGRLLWARRVDTNSVPVSDFNIFDFSFPQANALSFGPDGNSLIVGSPKKPSIFKIFLDDNVGTSLSGQRIGKFPSMRCPALIGSRTKDLTSAGDFVVGPDGALYGLATCDPYDSSTPAILVRWPADGRGGWLDTAGVIGKVPYPGYGLARVGNKLFMALSDTYSAGDNYGTIAFDLSNASLIPVSNPDFNSVPQLNTYEVRRGQNFRGTLWGATSEGESGIAPNEGKLIVRKNFVSRKNLGDQVRLHSTETTVNGGYLFPKVTTTGTRTGIQTEEHIEFVQVGSKHYVHEELIGSSNLSDYGVTVSCEAFDKNNRSTGETFTISDFTLSRKTAHAALNVSNIPGATTICTFTNDPAPISVTLLKKVDNLGFDLANATENQWQLSLTKQGATSVTGTVTGALNKTTANTIKNVSPGTYSISETSDVSGYEMRKVQRLKRDQNGVVNHDSDEAWEDIDPSNVIIERGRNDIFRFVNSPKPGKVRWTKVASGTSTLLGGSEWQLNQKRNGRLIPVTDSNVNIIRDCEAAPCTGKDTDPTSGVLVVEGLPWGEYVLTESKAPAGYSASTQQYEFTVDGNSVDLGEGYAGLTLNGDIVPGNEISNEKLPTGAKRIDKVALGSGTPLPGSTWRLTRVSDTGQVLETIADPGKDTITDCVGTSENQCTGRDKIHRPGELWIPGLYYGKYELREVTAPEGYEPSPHVYKFEISATSWNNPSMFENGVRNVRNTVTNAPKPGKIRWNKVDSAQTSTLLAGSEWLLTGTVGQTEVKIVDAGRETIADCVGLPCTGRDQDPTPGKFLIEGLQWGQYTLVEKVAPERYELNQTSYSFEVNLESVKTENGESVISGIVGNNLPNNRAIGQKRIDKLDADTRGYLGGTTWRLTRVSDDGTVLETVTDPGSDVITDCAAATSQECTGRDTEKQAGLLWLPNLRFGKYELREVSAPAGYEVSDQVYTFEITPKSWNNPNLYKDGKSVRNTVLNKKIPGKTRWNKVETGTNRLLAGSEWNLTRTESGQKTTISDPGATVIRDCVAASATDCVGLDKDPETGRILLTDLAWGEYTLTEARAPEGYDLNETEYSFTVNLETVTSGSGESPIKNGTTPVNGNNILNAKTPTGVIRIDKVDSRYTSILLPGASWYITRLNDQGDVVETIADPGGATVADCVANSASECRGRDKDPKVGQFWLTELKLGRYEVREAVAPNGYEKTDLVYTFEVTREKLRNIPLKQAGNNVPYNKIPNTTVETPALPLTGGYGIYLPIGLGMLLMLVGARRLQVQNS